MAEQPVDKTRVQLDFQPDRVEELNTLQKKCGLVTRKDLFEASLTLLEWCVQQRIDGRVIVSIDHGNKKQPHKELSFPPLNQVQPKV